MNSYDTIIDNDCVEVYRGKYFKSNKYKKVKKVVVLDLDETLGSFTELDILWHTIEYILKDNPIDFFDLFDLFPEFQRVGIMKILEYIYNKKNKGGCYKLYIYTNNQSESFYVKMICDYFTSKICKNKNDVLFDQIIYAFKINNQIIQFGRTSHQKSHSDLINCTLIPKNAAICFLDDINFDKMKKERIYYIRPEPYHHQLSPNDILKRFFSSNISNAVSQHKHFFTDYFLSKALHKQPSNKAINHFTVYKKMMYHIKEFFILSSKHKFTKRKRKCIAHYTKKNINVL